MRPANVSTLNTSAIRPPTRRNVHVSKMFVKSSGDHVAQRRADVSEKSIRMMLTEFRTLEGALGALRRHPLVVSQQRDGTYAIVDGQHRWLVIRELADEQWLDVFMPCEVYSGLTLQQEAQLFLEYSKTKLIKRTDKFAIAFTAGERWALEITETCAKFHFKVGTTSNSKSVITAIATLERVYNAGGQDLLSRTLEIATQAFGWQGTEGEVLDGISRILSKLPDIDAVLVVRKLQNFKGGILGIQQTARAIRGVHGSAMPMGRAVAEAMLKVINSHTRSKLSLDA